jgi:Tol biopolymer transport system component
MVRVKGIINFFGNGCKSFRVWTSLLMILMAGGCAARPSSEIGILSQIVQLTDGFDRAGEAYFSHNMRWIVFQATPRGENVYQMYVAPVRVGVAEGWPGKYPTPPRKAAEAKSPPLEIQGIGSAIRITPAGSKNTCGFFSPDGVSMIFASTALKSSPSTQSTQPASAPGYQRSSGTYRWEFPAEMEIFRADGWESAISAADAKTGTNLAQHALTHNDAYDAECSYSPDGQWIVFTSNRTGDNELFAMRPDGSDVVQLTQTHGYDGGPFFSPDGKTMVYRSDRAGNDLLQIFVADIVRDGSGRITRLTRERQLTRDGNVNWGPYWHPDGKHIIYATSAHGHQNYELYLMRSDGSHKTRITFTEGFDGLPVFSPDGRFLMWSSKRSRDGTTQVFVAKFKMPRGA